MTTLNLQVGASADDAREDNTGGMALTSLYIAIAGFAWWAGHRFTDVTIPQGATINSATLSLYVYDTGYDDVYLDAYCNDVDDAGTFTTTSGDISGRALTTASTNVGAGAVGVGWYPITITTAVQEIISRGTWVSGNALAVILDGLVSVYLRTRAWDDVTSEAAKLDIDYTPPAGGLSIPVAMHHLRQQGIA